MTDPCSFPFCGRPGEYRVRNRVLCRGHYHQRLRGSPLRRLGRPRGSVVDEPTVRLPGVRVRKETAAKIERAARGRGLSPYNVVIEVVEAWAEAQSP